MSGASEGFSRFALVVDVQDALGRGSGLSIQSQRAQRAQRVGDLQWEYRREGFWTLESSVPWGMTYELMFHN